MIDTTRVRTMMRLTVSSVLFTATVIFAAVRLGWSTMSIDAAGATFPASIYSKWFDVYAQANPGVQINYQSVGSGAGIDMLVQRTVDMGATDAPMTDEQMKQAPGKILHFPSVMGAVVIAYNLPELKTPLKLTGPIIADIFMGKITKWNDPALAALYPGIKLPETRITPCYRSDASGTTYILADYLSKVSPDWASVMGKSTSLKWQGGSGGQGNAGVTALVHGTPGAIGYLEFIYAADDHIPFADLQNHDGKWVTASLDGVSAAAATSASNMPADFRVSITDAPGPDSYPISSFTWLLVYQQQTDGRRGNRS